MESFKADGLKEARMEAELKEFQKENVELRQHIMALQGEVYGARLAAKYLDKELAGRWVASEQIQLISKFVSKTRIGPNGCTPISIDNSDKFPHFKIS